MRTPAGGTNWYHPRFHTLDEMAVFLYTTASVNWTEFLEAFCHEFQGG